MLHLFGLLYSMLQEYEAMQKMWTFFFVCVFLIYRIT